ncbi:MULTISPECIES: hypothetical protein [Mycobacteriaceae]|uniref:TetR family transcriptional regulator n=1 Tax=Mycobacterium novum TaxID=2492438 RepID=A0A7I7JPL5_9MYCO|nr:hypothetical protein [Mycobacterium novum]BBX13780.1 hypothetical protein MNVM_28610 [Mycobacterium novum]
MDAYTAAESAAIGSEYLEFPELDDRDFQRLAHARVGKLTKMFMPSNHPPVMELMVSIWVDGLASGMRMAREDA